MFEKLKKFGDGVFSDHEILEIALYYTIPRQNTNEIAHELLNSFGSIEGILNADPRRLTSVDGIGEASATFFSVLSALFRRCEAPPQKNSVKFDTVSSVCSFLQNRLSGEQDEHFCAMLLDNSMHLIKFVILSDGDVSKAPADAQKVARLAVIEGASSVIIAHNHPDGSVFPSAADRHVTRLVDTTLSAVAVSLIEHIIVGADNAAPTMISNFNPAPSAFGTAKPDDSFYTKFYGL